MRGPSGGVGETGRVLDVNRESNLLDRHLAMDTSAPTGVSGRCYAQYLGVAPCEIKSLELRAEIGGTAAATITWAEMAVATGAFEASAGVTSGTPDLTLRAGTVADISAEVLNTNFSIVKTVTPAVPIPAGTELWVLLSVSAVTQPVWRGTQGADFAGAAAIAAATRPSTMAAPTAFTGGSWSGGQQIPQLSARIVS